MYDIILYSRRCREHRAASAYKHGHFIGASFVFYINFTLMYTNMTDNMCIIYPHDCEHHY